MNNKPIALARELIEIYGITLLEDPERLGQLLEDKCSDCRHEIFVLSFALKELLRSGALPEIGAFERDREQIIQRFIHNLGFSPSTALWAESAIESLLQDWTLSSSVKRIEAYSGFLDRTSELEEGVMAKRPRTAPMRKKAFRNGFLLLGIIVLFLGLFVKISETRLPLEDSYRILFLSHLTGPHAAEGHVRLKGAQMATDRINSYGGIRGRELRIQLYDMPYDPHAARNALLAILKDRKVNGIISACDEWVNIAIAPMADEKEIPVIMAESTMTSITMASEERPWLYSFRTNIDSEYRGRIMAYFGWRGIGRKRAVIVFEPESPGSSEAYLACKAACEEYGLEIAAEVPCATNSGTDREDALYIASTGADLVIIAVENLDTAVAVVSSLRKIGYTEATVASVHSEPKRAQNDPQIQNSWWIIPASEEDPQLQSYRTSYRDKYNEVLTGDDFTGALLAYDSVMWMSDALSRAPGFQGEALRHALLSTRNLALSHATLSIDPRTHGPWNKAVALLYYGTGKERFQKRFRLQ